MSTVESFYQLDRAPFASDARTPCAVGTHPLRDALTAAQLLLETDHAAVCVCGPPGVGKSVFGLALRALIAESAHISFVTRPDQPWEGFAAQMVRDFGLEGRELDRKALERRRRAGRRLVLQIDPAEAIPAANLCQLESILRRDDHGCLVQVVLIANLEDVGRDHPLAAAIERGSVEKLDLRPLPGDDVPGYIQRRLEHVGYVGAPLFSPAAAREVYRRSDGIPAEINRICRRALELGAERELRSIAPDDVAEACDGVRLAILPLAGAMEGARDAAEGVVGEAARATSAEGPRSDPAPESIPQRVGSSATTTPAEPADPEPQAGGIVVRWKPAPRKKVRSENEATSEATQGHGRVEVEASARAGDPSRGSRGRSSKRSARSGADDPRVATVGWLTTPRVAIAACSMLAGAIAIAAWVGVEMPPADAAPATPRDGAATGTSAERRTDVATNAGASVVAESPNPPAKPESPPPSPAHVAVVDSPEPAPDPTPGPESSRALSPNVAAAPVASAPPARERRTVAKPPLDIRLRPRRVNEILYPVRASSAYAAKVD